MRLSLNAIAAALLVFSAASAAHAVPETFTLDPMHSAVSWSINHFGFSNPSGKFTGATGTLTLDEDKPENSKVDVKIAISSLVTGLPKLDEHLSSKDFFDVAQFPTAAFVSDKVTVTGKDTATVSGVLTLHGVAKPVTLDVKLNKIGENMMKKKTAGFSLTTTLKRSDFGMNAYLPALGDEVKIGIESETNLAAGKP